MSLRGRYIIDRIKRAVSSHLKMPVPPYGEPLFWEQVYQKMETASPVNPETQMPDFDDTFEWGGITLQDVMEYQYRPVTLQQQQLQAPNTQNSYVPGGGAYEYASSSQVEDTLLSTTFGQTIGVEPSFINTNDDDLDDDGTTTTNNKKEPILMLGCGNSKMGEDMVDQGWRGPLIQVDIASKALEMIARRSSHSSSRLQFLQEDATNLTSLRNDTIHATVDKGLLDALFCADEHDQMTDIVKSVLRVLKPGGVFCIFSFSRPEFLLPWLLPISGATTHGYGHQQQHYPGNKPIWQDLQMQELDSFMIYRLQKSSSKGSAIKEPKRYSKKKQ